MTDNQLSYESAAARIEEIIKRLDSGEAGLRETLELVKEGRGLVEYCATELEAVGKGLQELRLDELIARLEAGASDAPSQAEAGGETPGSRFDAGAGAGYSGQYPPKGFKA